METAALVLVFLLCGLKSVLFGGLNLNFFLLLGILGLIKNIGIAIFYVLIAGAILSWFNRGNNPAFYALYQLTEPLLKPIKRILPTMGVIDFSPMVIAIVLLFLNNLFYDYFQVYGQSLLKVRSKIRLFFRAGFSSPYCKCGE